MAEPHPMWRACSYGPCRVLFKDVGHGVWTDLTWWCSAEHRDATRGEADRG